MPYRAAHWILLALFPLAGLAFWQSYLSRLTTASAEFHAHGVTAAFWLALVTAQSWTIHHERRALHRTLGTASLLLFPLFLGGGMAIFVGMAHRMAEGSPFHAMFAPRLAWVDLVTVAGFAFFYFEGLRQRRSVHRHAAYLLATVIFLLPPIIGRLLPALPFLTPGGPDELWKLGISFQLGNALTFATALLLALASGKHGRPFLIAAGLTALAAAAYQFIGGTPWWIDLYRRFGALPSAPFAIAAGLGGIAIAYAGWTMGERAGSRTRRAAAQ